jgi:aminopeptidase N
MLAIATLSAKAMPANAAQDWPILSHNILAEVDPARSWIEVTDTIALAPPPDPGQPLHLLLHRDLAVQSVLLRGRPLAITESERFQPRHFWARPDYERMGDYAVAREITVQPPGEGWPPDPFIVLNYAGAVYDTLHPPEVAYSRGFETTTGLIDARGAYLAGSTFWIPWNGEDLFTFTLRTVVPAGWESVSQGDWAERRGREDGRTESLWVVEAPMSEAYLIAGPYTVREKDLGEVTAYTFTYKDTPEDLCRTYLDATGEYLRQYDELIGPYPFGKFALVENWWQTGFGMPSFTLLGDRVIRLPFIVHTSYGHEILHNWWGNGVFVDYEQGNWCEGLTTYLADYTYKEREGGSAARDYRLKQLQGYLDYAGSGGHDFSLRRFTERESPSTQAVGYGKTMMVFHMARRMLGDDLFFAGLRRIYHDHLFQKASWDDLVAGFEAVSGRELAGWFDQWIDRPGAPVLSASRAPGPNGLGPVIRIGQTEPFYDLAVPVQYEVDGAVQTELVPLDGAYALVVLPAGTAWAAVDPEFELFRRLHRGEIPPTLSQVLGADSTVVVIGSRTDPVMAKNLRWQAEEWSRNHDEIIVNEADYTGPGGRGVWLFGEGELVDRLFAGTDAFGKAPAEFRARGEENLYSMVASFRDPEHPEIPITVYLPGSFELVDRLAKKLPHYGSYSFLAFSGESVVDKGRWLVETSPLRLDFSEER